MKKCPKCGFENPSDGIDCPQCGIVYAKFEDFLKKKESEEQPAPEAEAEVEAEQASDLTDAQPAAGFKISEDTEKKTFDWEGIITPIQEFATANYLWLIGAAGVLVVIIAIVAYMGSGVVGKRGTVTWAKILGPEAESGLLFDYIELLPDPEFPEESTEEDTPQSLCDLPNGTAVRVLEIDGDFLLIEVLSGDCSGEFGYILADHFEMN